MATFTQAAEIPPAERGSQERPLQVDRPVQHHPWHPDGHHQPVDPADLAPGHLPRDQAQPLDPLQQSYFLWVLMGFLLVTAVLVVSLGRVGDMYGRVRMYNLGFAGLHPVLDPAVGDLDDRRRRGPCGSSSSGFSKGWGAPSCSPTRVPSSPTPFPRRTGQGAGYQRHRGSGRFVSGPYPRWGAGPGRVAPGLSGVRPLWVVWDAMGVSQASDNGVRIKAKIDWMATPPSRSG